MLIGYGRSVAPASRMDPEALDILDI